MHARALYHLKPVDAGAGPGLPTLTRADWELAAVLGADGMLQRVHMHAWLHQTRP